jgi:RNA polymerase sigma factor (sigma-70 family)
VGSARRRNLAVRSRNQFVVSDRELVAAAAAGDAAAFAALAERSRERVEAVVRRMLPPDEAEDVTQEALLRAFIGMSRLRDPDRFVGWLCGIAVNLAKMRLRRLALQKRVAVGAPIVVADEDRELLRAVQDAVALLPSGQRDVVVMHYVDDLSCDEIARLLGMSPGAVRVRLHRARAQLRRELAPLAPVPLPMKKEEVPMVEMKVDDVLVRVVSEDQPDVVGDRRIIVLAEREGDRLLPIWIGSPEGDALALRLSGNETPRPMTFDLMAELLRTAGARVERVNVTALREQTFYATIAVAVDGQTEDVDARPSDAINLAVRVGASIFVDDGVLADQAVTRDALADKLGRDAEEGKADLPPGEWASLSAELLRRLHPPWGGSRSRL